jgi:guanylate kinase
MRIFVVSGPNGVGKSTVVRAWRKVAPELSYIRTTTTRSPRPDEVGIDECYEFVPPELFQRLLAGGEFAQWTSTFPGLWYGTRRRFIDEIVQRGIDAVVDYSPEMFHNFQRQYPAEVVGIFLAPPDFDTLVARMKARGTEGEDLLNRKIENARLDMEFVDIHDYCVVNYEVERSVRALTAIRTAEGLRLRADAATRTARVMWRYYRSP